MRKNTRTHPFETFTSFNLDCQSANDIAIVLLLLLLLLAGDEALTFVKLKFEWKRRKREASQRADDGEHEDEWLISEVRTCDRMDRNVGHTILIGVTIR